jgi:cell division protein FtsL
MQSGGVTFVIWPICVVFLLVQAMGLLMVKEHNRQTTLQLHTLDRELVKAANFWETLTAEKQFWAALVRVEEKAKSEGMVPMTQQRPLLFIHHE